MLQDPGNIAWEIGPHPMSYIYDLMGEPDEVTIEPLDPMRLPTGITFFKRFNIRCRKDNVQCDVYLNFVVGGFEEHEVRVRGTMGRASVNLERNAYVKEQHSSLDIDIDNFVMSTQAATNIARQAVGTLTNYALNKTKLANVGKNPYDTSIGEAIVRFYGSFGKPLDDRLSPYKALDVMKLADRVAQTAREKAGQQPSVKRAASAPEKSADSLVLGWYRLHWSRTHSSTYRQR